MCDVEHFEAHEATVHEHRVAYCDVFGKAWVVDVDTADAVFADAAKTLAKGKIEGFPLFELECFRHIARADLRAFNVHHNRDLAPNTVTYGAHTLYDFAGPRVVCVCHVDTADVDACVDQLFKHLLALCGWADGENDFCFAIGIFHREKNA